MLAPLLGGGGGAAMSGVFQLGDRSLRCCCRLAARKCWPSPDELYSSSSSSLVVGLARAGEGGGDEQSAQSVQSVHSDGSKQSVHDVSVHGGCMRRELAKANPVNADR